MDIAEARQRFLALVRQPQGAFRLAEGALLIAQEEYPELDYSAYLQRLDAMAAHVSSRLGFELEPQRIVETINTYLFTEQQFQGNREEYYDPRNSFLNDVLERKTGIPITLSVLYLDIGRQVGLPLVGVGMPGHFIVQYSAQPQPFWIDPFHQGEVLSRQDCVQLLEKLYRQALPWRDDYLRVVNDHEILARMLNNLKAIYVHRGDYQRALKVVERLFVLAADPSTELRDRGLLHAQLGNFAAALADLEAYLQRSQAAPDAAIISQQIEALRRRLAR